MAATPLRAAIVGTGTMGRWHAQAARRAGSVLAAAVDTNPGRAVGIGAASTFGSLDDALASTPVDLVHVCTPLDTHAELATKALAAGAHVLVEKPLAADGETTERLLGESESAGRLLVPAHQLLFQRGVRRVVRNLAALGELVDVRYTAATAGAELTGLDADELVRDVLPHPLSLFERLLPGSTTGSWQTARPGVGELRALTWAGPTTLTIAITARGRPTRNELTVTGTRGTAHLDLFHGFAVTESGSVSRRRKATRPLHLGAATIAAASANLAARAGRRQAAYPGLAELVVAVHAAARGTTRTPIEASETLAVARARDAIAAAAAAPTR